LKRETRHVDPITGELEGKGGITLLRSLFPDKRIVSFRAPGFSFSPPHLEALRELGIRFDFSADLSSTPVEHKGVTFFPCPILINSIKRSSFISIFRYFTRSRFAVFVFHPNHFVNSTYWDSIYFSGNPKKLHPIPPRSWKETQLILRKFDLLLRRLSHLENKGLFEVTTALERGKRKEDFPVDSVLKCYQKGIGWTENYLGYYPRFILNHYMKFFNLTSNNRTD